jgi:hypothetical protein
MLNKAVMTMLTAFSLSACSTLEIVHSDLKLPCMPEHNVMFKMGETDVMSDELYAKFKTIIVTYKERIKTQCKLANQHNEAHQ